MGLVVIIIFRNKGTTIATRTVNEIALLGEIKVGDAVNKDGGYSLYKSYGRNSVTWIIELYSISLERK